MDTFSLKKYIPGHFHFFRALHPRLLLCEVGYQAGQHELLSESLAKTIPAEIKTRVKEVNKEAGQEIGWRG